MLSPHSCYSTRVDTHAKKYQNDSNTIATLGMSGLVIRYYTNNTIM